MNEWNKRIYKGISEENKKRLARLYGGVYRPTPKEIAERKRNFENRGRIAKNEILNFKIDINLFK